MNLNGHFSKIYKWLTSIWTSAPSHWSFGNASQNTASPTRMVTNKTQKMTSIDEDVEKLEPLHSVGEKVRGAAAMDISVVGLHIENRTNIWSSDTPSGYKHQRTESRSESRHTVSSKKSAWTYSSMAVNRNMGFNRKKKETK